MEITKDHVRLILTSLIVGCGSTKKLGLALGRTASAITGGVSHGSIPAPALVDIIKKDLVKHLTGEEKRILKAYGEHVRSHMNSNHPDFWVVKRRALREKLGLTNG